MPYASHTGRKMHRGRLTGTKIAKMLQERALTVERFAELTGRRPNSLHVWLQKKQEKAPEWIDKWFWLYDQWVQERGTRKSDADDIIKVLARKDDVSHNFIAKKLKIPDALVKRLCEEMMEDGKLS
jgi:hypothetical protein